MCNLIFEQFDADYFYETVPKATTTKVPRIITPTIKRNTRTLSDYCVALNNVYITLPETNPFKPILLEKIAIYSKATTESWSCHDQLLKMAESDMEKSCLIIAKTVLGKVPTCQKPEVDKKAELHYHQRIHPL